MDPDESYQPIKLSAVANTHDIVSDADEMIKIQNEIQESLEKVIYIITHSTCNYMFMISIHSTCTWILEHWTLDIYSVPYNQGMIFMLIYIRSVLHHVLLV